MANSIHEALDYERGLLGYILYTRKMQKVFGYITKDDFADKQNAILYETLSEIAANHFDRAIDEKTLLNSLRENNALKDVGGPQYIAGLIDQAALEANVPHIIQTLSDKANLRRIEKVLKSLASKVEKEPSMTTDKAVSMVEEQIILPNEFVKLRGFIRIDELVQKVITVIENKKIGEITSGVLTGFRDLDELLNGMQRGDLVIVAARPSMGKTAFAINIAAHVAREGNVAFFSVEMDSYQIVNRILSLEGTIEGNKLIDPKRLTPSDEQRLYLSQDNVARLKLFINDTAGIKLHELVWQVKLLHKNNPLSLIVIDYLQLITLTEDSNAFDSRQLEVAHISRVLKKLARELNVPVVALSQLSRRVEQRESKIPMLSDLRESGAIEQDADIIAFLYREEYYKREEEKSLDPTQKVSVIISKHRNGATGSVNLAFDPRYGLFSNLKKDFS